LIQACFRGQAPYVTFLFFRLVSPALLVSAAAFYMFVMGKFASAVDVSRRDGPKGMNRMAIASWLGTQGRVHRPSAIRC